VLEPLAAPPLSSPVVVPVELPPVWRCFLCFSGFCFGSAPSAFGSGLPSAEAGSETGAAPIVLAEER